MRKKTILIFSFLAFFSFAYPSNFCMDRLTIKIGYQHYPWMGDNTPFSNEYFTPTGYVEANYPLNNFWEIGANLGGSLYERIDYPPVTGPGIYVLDVALKPMITYGINSKLKLFPLIFKRNFSFLDLYIASKLGGIYFVDRIESKHARKLSQFDYGVYGGIAVYPFKKWGFYYECGFSNYAKWRAGISLRF